jgi:hypothetical protein
LVHMVVQVHTCSSVIEGALKIFEDITRIYTFSRGEHRVRVAVQDLDRRGEEYRSIQIL